MGRRIDEGGVCKAEGLALETEELNERLMLSLKGSLLFELPFVIPIAGEGCGVIW
jgi:hypothetical protein